MDSLPVTADPEKCERSVGVDVDKDDTTKCSIEKPPQQESDNESTNYISENFDPLQALYSNDLSQYEKKFKRYDNLAMFEAALNKFGVQVVGSLKKPAAGSPKKDAKTTEKTKKDKDTSIECKNPFKHESTLIERNFSLHQMPIPGIEKGKVRHNRNLMKNMENVKGPLELLKKFIENKKKICIYTRKEHGIRSKIIGNLIAFDKHMNLLLEDTFEVCQKRKYNFCENNISNYPTPAQDCSERLKLLGLKLPEVKVKSLNRKYVKIERTCKQLLIRGEQVVLIKESNDEIS